MKFDPNVDITQAGLFEASTELEWLISAAYPSVRFTRQWLDDPEGLHLQVLVPFADPKDIFNLVSDRLLHFQIEEGLSLYIVPRRPIGEVIKQLKSQLVAVLPPQANP